MRTLLHIFSRHGGRRQLERGEQPCWNEVPIRTSLTPMRHTTRTRTSKQPLSCAAFGPLAGVCSVGEPIMLCWHLERSSGDAAGHDSNTLQYDIHAVVRHMMAHWVILRLCGFGALPCAKKQSAHRDALQIRSRSQHNTLDCLA